MPTHSPGMVGVGQKIQALPYDFVRFEGDQNDLYTCCSFGPAGPPRGNRSGGLRLRFRRRRVALRRLLRALAARRPAGGPPVSPPVSPPRRARPPTPRPSPATARHSSTRGVVAGLRNCQLPALITGAFNIPKTAGVVYSVSSVSDVGQDRGGDANAPVAAAVPGILSIDPGVAIFGSGGLDFIRVNRGSQILANGTAAEPIIFTSRADVENARARRRGGGRRSGRPSDPRPRADQRRLPGRPDPEGLRPSRPRAARPRSTRSSAKRSRRPPTRSTAATRSRMTRATATYVVVVSSGLQRHRRTRKLNGITMSGVGNGTQVENVQVHQSSDDGIELLRRHGEPQEHRDHRRGRRLVRHRLRTARRGPVPAHCPAEHQAATAASNGPPTRRACTPPFDGTGSVVVYRSQPRVSNATIVMRSSVVTRRRSSRTSARRD